MSNCTDLKSGGDFTAEVTGVLDGVAAHLTTTRPTELLADGDLLATVGATAYKRYGRTTNGHSGRVSRAAMHSAPTPTPGITRGEYALRLRGVAHLTPAQDGH